MKGNVIYIVMRYNNIYGVYEKFEDATQAASVFISKGNVCDIKAEIIK